MSTSWRLCGLRTRGQFRHLGGIIATKKGSPVQITFRNRLTGLPGHIIPVDTSIPGADLAEFRTAVHLHGGFVPWISDGGPFAWWDATGVHGESFLNDALKPRGIGKVRVKLIHERADVDRVVRDSRLPPELRSCIKCGHRDAGHPRRASAG